MSQPKRPQGFSTLTPFIMAKEVDKIIDFAKQAFGGEVTSILHNSKGEVWHCQMKIGDSMIMFADTMGEHDGTTSCQYLYVDNPDAVYKKAVAAGGKEFAKPEDQFYGDRAGGVIDPAGNYWWVAKQIEEVSQGELERRAAAQETKSKAA